MKNLMFLLLVSLVMLFSCAKETYTDEAVDLKKAAVPVPMKASFCLTPDFSIPLTTVSGTPLIQPGTGIVIIPEIKLPGGGLISGHATHMGEIITAKSAMTTVGAWLTMTPGGPVIVANYTGKITADNGDFYLFNSTLNISLPGMGFTGVVDMFDGIGKFEGMTGSVEVTGQGDPASLMSCWTGVGTMEF